MCKISFVIPCYGSEKTIKLVTDEIIDVITNKTKFDYEIICVNDCSPDGVLTELLSLAKNNARIKVIDFAKNMNRPGAVMAGLNYSSGDYVVVMDDDGQCPMNEFMRLIEPLFNGYDVSMADYPKRKQSVFKDFGTNVNKLMTSWALERPKNIEFTNFMVMKRFVVDEIVKYKNPYPYMTGLILRVTQNITNVTMEERNRYEGKTNFTFKKMIQLWMNGITAFSIKPLRLSSFAGFIFAFIGFVYGIFVVLNKILSPDVSVGWSSIIAILLVIGGLLLLMLGIIGEYIGRIYISINNSPQYVIKQMINFDKDKINE